MRKSFTLIELLVVVAIIGILVSLLLPSLDKARKMTKVAVCGSNNKQLFNGFMLYSKNDNYRLPPGARNINVKTYTENVSWDDQISIYMGKKYSTAQIDAESLPHEDINILMCPEDNKHLRDGTYLIRSYVTNSWRQWGEHSQNYQSGLSNLHNNSSGIIGQMISRGLGEISSTSNTLLLTEGWQGKAGKDWYSAIARESDIDVIATFNLHTSSRRNYLMSDGHVEYDNVNKLYPNAKMLDSNP